PTISSHQLNSAFTRAAGRVPTRPAARVNAEFNWWLLIVGLVIGAALVYLVLADASRRESELTAEERPLEATWIAATLRAEGIPMDPSTAERVLELHREYLAAPPPDEPSPDDDPDAPFEDEAVDRG
ncbi:MAG TPA: hypothetical protein VM344_00705, partial [Vitreimonas sp.]|nr:hypothetical protein [Vitreimonas sp.]